MGSIIKNVFSILLENKKKDVSLLLFFMFTLSMFEILGLGALIPVIDILSKPEEFFENSNVIFINNFFGFSNEYNAIFLILFGLISFFVFKAVYSLLIIYKQQVFVNTIFKDLSVGVLENSISLKYSVFRRNDKSFYLKDIVTSSAYLALCTFNILQFFTELFVLISIVVFLSFYIGFLNSFYLLVVVLMIGFIFRSVTHNISKYGRQRDLIMHSITKSASEALSGYKEIRNNNVLEKVILEYERKAKPYINVYAKFGTIINMPKIVLESITALTIVGYLFYVFYLNIPIVSVMQNLIVFAFVGLRTIPCLTKLMGAAAQIKYFGSESSKFKKLFLNLEDKYKYTDVVEKMDKSIEFSGICYRYPGKEKNTLTDINFKIEKNKKYGFVGQSGSGKSTLFDILLGLISPTSGLIKIDSNEYKTLENVDINRVLGCVSQNIFILDGSLKSNVFFFSDKENEEKYRDAINGAQLEDYVADNDDHLVGENGANLSGGQKQRLAIARSLYADKSILLLDEATSALDNQTERRFMDYLNSREDKTVLIIAHRLSTIKECDEIFVFKDGGILESGSFDELSIKSSEFKKLLNNSVID